ncbi:hypothetical protein ACQ4PT_071810 [Festuca glaucescens]
MAPHGSEEDPLGQWQWGWTRRELLNYVYVGGFACVRAKQEEDPRPPEDPANPYGFLRFPTAYMPELDSLASKVRGDVRRACCVVSGGVYENVLFFPVVQLLKDRYPGVLIDVVASARGKQVYEMCKNVRYANVYDPDDEWPEPAEYTHQLGVMKVLRYDPVDQVGRDRARAVPLHVIGAREGRIRPPNVNGAGAGLFLTEMFKPPTTNLSDGGYYMYQEMLEWLGRPAKGVPQQPIPPLRVSISKKLRAIVEDKYSRAGVEKSKYVVVHGIESDSVANMKSRGDDDCLLPLEQWAEIAKEISSGGNGLRPLFVMPHEKHREEIEDIVGKETSYLFITTPGQLTCLINDSAGVVATNTAAVQLANARDKPCVALFSSKEKARVFLPYAEEKRSCTIVASTTGKLGDIDIEAVKNAVKDFQPAPSFALAQQ